MSDRNNTDNQNTNTIYISPEVREMCRKQQQSQQQKPKKPPQYNNQQQQQYQQQQPQQQYYNNQQQYQQQPQQQYYNNQQQYQQQQPQQQYYNNQQQYQQQSQQQYYNNQQQYQQQPQQQYYNNQQQYQQQPQQQYYNNQQQYQPYPPPPPPPPQPQNRPPQKKKKSSAGSSGSKKKKRKNSLLTKILGRILLVVFIVFLLIFGVYSCTVYKMIGKMDYSETGARNRTAGALAESYVTSILLIGTDGRTSGERGRSDTMILLSVNDSSDTISLTSFMRDCYVEIPSGYGWDKLNSAYSYGGAELLMDTIEHNFGVKIDNYIAVNFISFANIIDSLGGIDLEISDAEAQEINNILQAEVNSIMGDDTISDLISGGGKIHLNGKQALSYSRIRYVGNADFERTERQRKVMELVIEKTKSSSVAAVNDISANVLPHVVTNMTSGELYKLSLKVPFVAKYETQQLQIPAENTYYSENTSSGDALIVDMNENYNIIKNVVYSK